MKTSPHSRLQHRAFIPGSSGVVVLAAMHQREAMPLHSRIITIFGLLSAMCVIGGIVGIIWNAVEKTKFSLFGMELTTGHVGVAFVGIGMVTALFTVRAVLKSQHDLAALPADDAPPEFVRRKKGRSNPDRNG